MAEAAAYLSVVRDCSRSRDEHKTRLLQEIIVFSPREKLQVRCVASPIFCVVLATTRRQSKPEFDISIYLIYDISICGIVRTIAEKELVSVVM